MQGATFCMIGDYLAVHYLPHGELVEPRTLMVSLSNHHPKTKRPGEPGLFVIGIRSSVVAVNFLASFVTFLSFDR